MFDAAGDKKKQVSLKKPASPTLNFQTGPKALFVRNYNKLRALPTLYQQERGFARGTRLHGHVEFGYVRDRFPVHLDDNVALLESGSRSGRIRVDLSDDDALRSFGGLQLLAEIRC